MDFFFLFLRSSSSTRSLTVGILPPLSDVILRLSFFLEKEKYDGLFDVLFKEGTLKGNLKARSSCQRKNLVGLSLLCRWFFRLYLLFFLRHIDLIIKTQSILELQVYIESDWLTLVFFLLSRYIRTKESVGFLTCI